MILALLVGVGELLAAALVDALLGGHLWRVVVVRIRNAEALERRRCVRGSGSLSEGIGVGRRVVVDAVTKQTARQRFQLVRLTGMVGWESWDLLES